MKYLFAALILMSSHAFGVAEVGQPAPDFNVVASDGKTYKLSDFRGQNIVLEWYNRDCPYVRKHYDSKNMQNIQKTVAGDKTANITWLTVVSSAKDKQGYLSNTAAKEQIKKEGMNSKVLLLDSTGEMGKAYGATTTPHMFIIDTNGKVVYTGAIDSVSSASSKDIPTATNYVLAAVNELKAGKPVTTATTKPYGCGVKY